MLPKPEFVVDGGDTKNCFPFIIIDNSRKCTGATSSSGNRHSKLDGYRTVLQDRPLCTILMIKIICKILFLMTMTAITTYTSIVEEVVLLLATC